MPRWNNLHIPDFHLPFYRLLLYRYRLYLLSLLYRCNLSFHLLQLQSFYKRMMMFFCKPHNPSHHPRHSMPVLLLYIRLILRSILSLTEAVCRRECPTHHQKPFCRLPHDMAVLYNSRSFRLSVRHPHNLLHRS